MVTHIANYYFTSTTNFNSMTIKKYVFIDFVRHESRCAQVLRQPIGTFQKRARATGPN